MRGNRCCFKIYQILPSKRIRGTLVRWSPKLLLLLAILCLLYVVTRHNIAPVTLSLTRHLTNTPTARNVSGPMLFFGSSFHDVICPALINRKITNKTQLDTLRNLIQFPLANQHVDNNSVVEGCQALKLKHGYTRWSITAQEQQFPLAFSFKIHKNPDTFLRLLSVMWRPHNFYCVHVDAKSSPYVYDAIVKMTRCLDNVVVTKTRVNVVYGSIFSLLADIQCVREALRSAIQWRYHINLCGHEFPLKTNLEMVQILAALNGVNDVENYPPSSLFFARSFKYKLEIFNGVSSRITNITKAPFQHQSVEIRKGSAYNSLTRPFLHWALTDQMNLEFLTWLNDTWAPDELFWATLSFRSDAPGGPRVEVRHDTDTMLTKAVNWHWDPYACHGVYVRWICIFSSLDLPWLLTRHELIANKFDVTVDVTVLDCLEAELERRAMVGYSECSPPRTDGSWPLVSSVNWTLYNSLPQFSKGA